MLLENCSKTISLCFVLSCNWATGFSCGHVFLAFILQIIAFQRSVCSCDCLGRVSLGKIAYPVSLGKIPYQCAPTFGLV